MYLMKKHSEVTYKRILEMDMSHRVNLTIPDKLYMELKLLADYQGRTLANLCNYLTEKAVDDLKARGEFPEELQNQVRERFKP